MPSAQVARGRRAIGARAARRDARARSAGSAPSRVAASSARDRRRRVAVLRQDQERARRARDAGADVSSGRPCRVSVAHSASGQPSRAAARLKALGCGRIDHFLAAENGGRAARRRRTTRVAARQHDDPPAAHARRCRRSYRRAAVARGGARRRRSAPSPDGARRRRAPRRSRPARAPPARNPASPSSPMPMTREPGVTARAPQQRVDRRRGERAAAAPACSVDEGEAERILGERRLGLGGADKPDRKAENERRLRRARGDHLEQMKERGRRVADRDHGALEMRPPQLDRGGRARGPELARESGHAGSLELQTRVTPERRRVMPAATIAASTRIGAPSPAPPWPGGAAPSRPAQVFSRSRLAARRARAAPPAAGARAESRERSASRGSARTSGDRSRRGLGDSDSHGSVSRA